ncbi:MAG: tRNA (adenosine(37)-N6)-threonylcarbamoyltransferase complex ATPase subunit type 1 TsaE [Spirochaetota bacterium]
MTRNTHTADETIDLGINLGKKLKAGSIVALKGILGAGKTTLVKGIARGLNITEEITSPSFTIISEYRGSLPLYHMDLLRISGIEEFDLLGVDEMLYGSGVSVIEWSEKVEKILPPNRISVEISLQGDGSRLIGIEGVEI